MNIVEKIKKKRVGNTGVSDRIFELWVTIMVTIFLIIVLYPLIYVVSSSFSSEAALVDGRVILWPVDFSIKGYQMVFQNRQIWKGYANTIIYTLSKTTVTLCFTTAVAYAMSRKEYSAKKFLNWIYIIPMWISGGLIPFYILVSDLGMVNNRWGYILMSGVSIGHMVIIRTYFQSSIPVELWEATQIDGGNDYQYLFKVVLQLSKPVLAVIALYNIVGNWNDYFGAMIYLRKEEIQPLQIVIRQILASSKMDASSGIDATLAEQADSLATVMKYAVIMVSTVPMVMLFPFVQKFFNKGVMIGSLKG